MTTAVVTDSAANLADGQDGIRVVPMFVTVDGITRREGLDVTGDDIEAALLAGSSVTTAHPGPEAFLAAYRAAAETGASDVVSAHLSSRLSGACNAARLAATESPVPVTIIDSQTVGMGLGFAVLAGAARARAGESAEIVAEAIRSTAARTGVWFCVDNLEYLRRGGRIGAARALLGNALAIKPLLTISAGEVAPFDRVRTTARAMARLEEVAVERAQRARSQLAVCHLAAADRAEALAARLRERLPSTPVSVTEIASVISAHSGPGTVAIVVAPAEES